MACSCPCGHVQDIAHSLLQYNPPSLCPVCEREVIERRRMEIVASKAAGEAALNKWKQEQQIARFKAQQAQEAQAHAREVA